MVRCWRYHLSSLTLSQAVIIIFVKMGQDLAPAQQTPKQSHSTHASLLNSARKSAVPLVKLKQRIECEGLLKLRTTPFKNSIQIETESELIFLENVETTLEMLLEPRINTNKLFMLEDVEKLIESVIFTLAFLQQNNITYKDVNPHNIFYENGVFKMLPNELIEHSTYQKLKMQEETFPSPELLIGLRLGEEDVDEQDILEKCNVFTFGMVMLEVTTLLPSIQCYDMENYQIFDPVLKERVMMVSQYYGEKMARVIANMLDYDFTERMTLKDLSIWINREFQHQKPDNNAEQLSSSMLVSKHIQRSAEGKCLGSNHHSMLEKTTKKLAKNNSVYMGQNSREASEHQRQQRNKIYVNERMRERQLQPSNKFFPGNERSLMALRNEYMPSASRNVDKVFHHQQFNQSDSFRFKQEPKNELRHPNPYCDQFKFPRQQKIDKDPTKRISKPSVNPYRIQYNPSGHEAQEAEDSFESNSRQQAYPLKDMSNHHQYYPKVGDILQANIREKADKKVSKEDGSSVVKIKEEIMRSKRMLEQFRRNEGLKM